jgi:hypothetical protein
MEKKRKTVSGKGLQAGRSKKTPDISEGVTSVEGFEFHMPAGKGLLENHVQFFCASYPDMSIWMDTGLDELLLHVRIENVDYLLGHIECRADGTARLVRYLRPLWAKRFFMRLEKHLVSIGYKPVTTGQKNSGHYLYPDERERQEIVEHWRHDKRAGYEQSKEQWAQDNYRMTARTLFNYEREFPEVET